MTPEEAGALGQRVPELVKRLRDILAAASPGPWLTTPVDAETSEFRAGPGDDDGIPHTDLYREYVPIEVERSEPGTLVGHVDMREKQAANVACLVGESEADRALILAARNDLPRLLDALEALAGLVKSVRWALVDADDFPNELCDALDAVALTEPEENTRHEAQRQIRKLRARLVAGLTGKEEPGGA